MFCKKYCVIVVGFRDVLGRFVSGRTVSLGSQRAGSSDCCQLFLVSFLTVSNDVIFYTDTSLNGFNHFTTFHNLWNPYLTIKLDYFHNESHLVQTQ